MRDICIQETIKISTACDLAGENRVSVETAEEQRQKPGEQCQIGKSRVLGDQETRSIPETKALG